MHLSFNLGFPNAYDRSHGRTGSFLMVHGGCTSIGCYAVTDRIVDEIWLFVTKALDNGQTRIPVHAFPFRMTDYNLRIRKGSRWSDFWAELRQGYDLFEKDGIPPVVSVCNGRYAFAPGTVATASELVEERCPPETAASDG
jgi:murein L,D-transpeptidase YafK